MFSATVGSFASLCSEVESRGVEVGVVDGCVAWPAFMQETGVRLESTNIYVIVWQYGRKKHTWLQWSRH